MASPTTAWDGHGPMSGVDTGTHPGNLSQDFATDAVNRTFRGGQNSTRPPIQSKLLTFETDEDKATFSKGNVQGAFAYQKHLQNTQPHLIVAVGDRLMKGRMAGDEITFSTLFKFNTSKYMKAWFVQGEDRLFYQNDVDRPVGWDGKNAAYVTPEDDGDGMPIGNIMTYIHGRIVVFTASNHALVSDYVYGAGLNDTRGLEKFIEIQQYNDLGAIATPALLGSITGAIPVPRLPNRDGQGDLLIVTKNGGYTLRLVGLRADWLTDDIQQIVLNGTGGASDTSLLAANNDVWFRSNDGGLTTYKFERSDADRRWGNTDLAREVGRYLNLDSPRDLKYSSSILAHNRLITTCAITKIDSGSGSGDHRFGQGMVVLDFDRGSTVNQRTGFSWDGLWTGINPTALASLVVDDEIRPLALSHDEDGQNRVYEFMPDGFSGSDMAEGVSRSIVGFYELPHLFDQREPSNGAVVMKRLNGGVAEVSGVGGKATLRVEYRPNYYPCWFPFSPTLTIGTDDPQLTEAVDQREFYDILRWGVSEEAKEQASIRLARTARFFTSRAHVIGNMKVNDLRIEIDVKEEDRSVRCPDDETRFDRLISCPSDGGLFSYKIVPIEGLFPDEVAAEPQVTVFTKKGGLKKVGVSVVAGWILAEGFWDSSGIWTTDEAWVPTP